MNPSGVRAEEIAQLVKGTVVGNPDLLLTGVNSLELATPEQVSFVNSPKHAKDAERSTAGCLIASAGFSDPRKTVIAVEHPKAAFAHVMWLFHPRRFPAEGVHPSASVDLSASLGPGVSIGPGASVGSKARLGSRVTIGAGVAVGDRVQIGEEAVIYPNVTIYHDVVIGARVIIHAGSVIGADGFGFVFTDGRHLKIPQLGAVVIEDDVEIGANCTIDRATFGSTVIQRGTKMDNLVHVAHNVRVGEHSLLVAQVGVAGSSKIGHHVTLAGQVGVADSAVVGDFVTLAGKSGVITGQRIESHQTVWGVPARPIEEAKRQLASLALLPELHQRLRSLEARLATLEELLKHSKAVSS